MIKVCPICGTEFEPQPHQQKYCSAECAKKMKSQYSRKYWKRHGKEVSARRVKHSYSKVCPVCNKEFQTNTLLKKYCSHECYRKAHNELARSRYHSKPKPKKPVYPCSGYLTYNVPEKLCLECDAKECRYD